MLARLSAVILVCFCGSAIADNAQLMRFSTKFSSFLCGPYVYSSGVFGPDVQAADGQDSSDLGILTKNRIDIGGQPIVSARQLRVPRKARAALNKAMDALRKHDLTAALHRIGEALVLYPHFSEALAARALIEQGSNPHQALEDSQEALQFDPDYAGAYVALASVYTTLRRPEDAIRTLKSGSSLMPLFWAAAYEMARALASEGNYAAALLQIERASNLAPRPDPLFRLAKADILLGLSDDSAAASELRAYLREDPNGRNASQARITLKKLESRANTTD